jgi:hypothetical protein
MYPRERISEDFGALAERLVGSPAVAVAPAGAASVAKGAFRLFGRAKDAARA